MATACEYTIIDADTHITEPPDTWTARVPAKFRDRVPHVVRDDEGRDVWLLDGDRIGVVGMTAVAGWHEPFPKGPPTLDDVLPAAYDARARLELMDENGIWAQVLYPNVGGFGSQKFLRIQDPELQMACVRAYNDFLIEWAEPDPRRFVAIAATPFWDPVAAVAEIERAAEMGHRGVLMTGEPQVHGLPYLGDRFWDPLWSVADEAGLPIHFHIGSGDMTKGFTPDRIEAHGIAATYALTSVDMFMRNGVQVADLLLSGVLERYPSLRFVSVESGIGWIPFVLEATDYSFAEATVQHEDGAALPSELFARQVYTCFWFEQFAPRHLLDSIPARNLMFETDFPHPTCLHGNVAEKVEGGLGHLDPELRERILWGTAAELYRIEGPTTEDAGRLASAAA